MIKQNRELSLSEVESRLPGRIKKIEEKDKKAEQRTVPVLCFLFGVNFVTVRRK